MEAGHPHDSWDTLFSRLGTSGELLVLSELVCW